MLRYPLDLDISKQNRVMFRARDKDGNDVIDIISLYMPSAVTFGDGASYGDFDLGILGGAGAEVGKALFEGEGNIKSAVEQAIGGTENEVSGIQKAALSQAFSNFGLGSSLAERPRDLYLQQQGAAINPNTVLQYTNSTIRSYSFSFKMVAQSKDEADAIKKIINNFRLAMYGKKSNNGLTLTYPAKFNITFYTPEGRNEYLPKIYKETYLEGLTANYNTTSNLTHRDGSPTEVEVSMTFRETKALSREDIEVLQ